MPGISVIIPVYQAKKYVEKCVESVKNQTFSDWEMLLVDDGCTDGSSQLCDQCAAGDERIRVFHKKRNGGVSAARNLALDEAKGDCIAFLDVDDRYECQCLETLWNLRLQADADSAACAHLNLWPDGTKQPETVLPAGIYDAAGIREGIVGPLLGDRLTQPVFNGFIWRFLFSREILRGAHITFEGAYLEDELFLMEYFCHAQKLAVTDQPLYRYFHNPSSATHKYMFSIQESFLFTFWTALCRAYEASALHRLLVAAGHWCNRRIDESRLLGVLCREGAVARACCFPNIPERFTPMPLPTR